MVLEGLTDSKPILNAYAKQNEIKLDTALHVIYLAKNLDSDCVWCICTLSKIVAKSLSVSNFESRFACEIYNTLYIECVDVVHKLNVNSPMTDV